MEAASFDTPPDEFNIVPVELGLNIIKHPRYLHAFLGDGYGSATEQRNQMVIRLLQDYMNNVSYGFRNSIVKLLYDSIGTEAGTGDQPPAQTGSGQYWFASGAKVAGTDQEPVSVASLLKDAGDVVTDAILFKSASTLPRTGETARAERARRQAPEQLQEQEMKLAPRMERLKLKPWLKHKKQKLPSLLKPLNP